ncbi:tRNA-specific adenosine deaminase 1 [Euwallacea fornicatus]|uniref:tRNA-specific adenosine deaminase 1 n=1 Tax=Euwallacea fornicatus TaxID=995702 RepID=UPI00338EEE1E
MHSQIAKLSLDRFKTLPKTGKPKETEWTVLSTIVKQQDYQLEVVALGTGSKCIGRSKLCPRGTVINDSHAEVMCRRAFVCYLYSELNLESSIFNFNKEKKQYVLKPNLEFHFFTTYVPCGDAAIFSKQTVEDIGEALLFEDKNDCTPPKRKKTDDIYRTGAKCLNDGQIQDSKADGPDYHVLGLVRTKPGRGDPTSSVSCSDKLAKWCHLGIQGSLLMTFLEKPIYLSTFTILSTTPFCEEALNRAMFSRLNDVSLTDPFSRHLLAVSVVNCEFDYMKNKGKTACPSSLSWYLNREVLSSLEIVVMGRKQGATKKQMLSGKSALRICKAEIFKSFAKKCIELKLGFLREKMTYSMAKALCNVYKENKEILLKKFGTWTRKDPKLLEFTF